MSQARIEEWKTRLLDLTLRNRLLNFRATRNSLRLACPAETWAVAQMLDALTGNGKWGQPHVLHFATEESDGCADGTERSVLAEGGKAVCAQVRLASAINRVFPDAGNGNAAVSELSHKGVPANGKTPPDSPSEKRGRKSSTGRGMENSAAAENLKTLLRGARATLRETGANVLFLTFGFLEFRDKGRGEDEVFRAPLLLLPVELRRGSLGGPFSLRYLESGTPFLNGTLLEKLRGALDTPPPFDPENPNVAATLAYFDALAGARVGWRVVREVWLGLFSFTNFALWKDLDDTERAGALLSHPVVDYLVNGIGKGRRFPSTGASVATGDLDSIPPSKVCCPLGADSSQLSAVLSAANGASFVLEGPPGTGKSQTITNLIFQCLSLGKTVLFVAEKRAALDVVHKRLRDCGIGDFCLELHSDDMPSRDVLSQFRSVLENPRHATSEPPEWQTVASNLEKVRRQLNDDAAALFDWGRNPCGLSLFDCMEFLFPHLPDISSGNNRKVLPTGAVFNAAAASREWLENARERVRLLAAAASVLGRPVVGHPLGRLGCVDSSLEHGRRVRVLAGELRDAAGKFRADARALAVLSGAREDAKEPDSGALQNFDELCRMLSGAEAKRFAGTSFCSLPASQFKAAFDLLSLLLKQREDAREFLRGYAFREEWLLALDINKLLVRWRRAKTAADASESRRVCDELFATSENPNRSPWAYFKNELNGGSSAAGNGGEKILNFAKCFAKGIASMAGNALRNFTGKTPVEEILERALKLRETLARLDSQSAFVRDFLGAEAWGGGRIPAAAVAAAGAWCAKFLALVEKTTRAVGGDAASLEARAARYFSGAEPRTFRGGLAFALEEFRRSGAVFREVFSRFSREAVVRERDDGAGAPAAPAVASPPPPAGMFALAQAVLETPDDALRAWFRWREARAAALAAGLSPLLKSLENGTAAADSIPMLFENTFRLELLNHVLVRDKSVLLDAEGHAGRVENFRRLDKESHSLIQRVVAARLAARLPRLGDVAGEFVEEMRTLSSQWMPARAGAARKKLSTRELLQTIPRLLPVIKPCVLMSPLSVARYLAPSASQKFDVVVFDEASQIPVWNAVGAIARGRSLVVAGDPRQLPPTSFFATAGDEDGDAVPAGVRDLESILSELQACGMENKSLRWHYRSRREGLVAFSNKSYYGGSLFTFPGTDAMRTGVEFRFVPNAVYDAGGTRTNRVEAEALVAELARRLRTGDGSRLSYGIVTFNSQQQRLIEDLLDKLRAESPELESHFSGNGEPGGEPVFVKNLENVQGDERDVMLFSIGHGRDAGGDFSTNFGPLNQEGGHRRLNVAVTRAKYEMHVFSGVRAADFPQPESLPPGVRDLRRFLDYAERGAIALAGAAAGGNRNGNANANIGNGIRESGESVSADAFSSMVAETLRRAGLTAQCDVGSSELRVDIAVADGAETRRFAHAISCCGKSCRTANTARDRELLPREVLAGLGWHILDARPCDWWYDSPGSATRLLSRLRGRA